MGTVEVMRPKWLRKINTLSAISRGNSCNRDCLRTVLQTIFAIITVTSFILIVMMSIPRPPSTAMPNISRCQISNCKVLCKDTPHLENYEEDIVNALKVIEKKCSRIVLVLENPIFFNSTLPAYWLSTLKVNIHDFTISNGNLRHITPGAFITYFAASLRRVEFVGVTIETWEEESLVGLLRLEELSVKDCNIVHFQENALGAVDDSLEILSIIESSYWNPKNVTGVTEMKKLTSVDFSNNYFYNILNSNSFTGLTNCKMLYLNSCRISAIGTGTFDYLNSIEFIFLNDNLLTTLPAGLFDHIALISPKPQVDLQSNLWFCECSSTELRRLITDDLLLFGTVCHDPEELRGVTLEEFEDSCNKTNYTGNFVKNRTEDFHEYIYINGTCYDNDNDLDNISYKTISPVVNYQCSLNTMKSSNIVTFVNTRDGLIKYDTVATRNNRMRMTNIFKTVEYSVIQLDLFVASGYGLLWFQSKCPNEVYCVNILPKFLRVKDLDLTSRYTFCAVELKTGLIEIPNCVSYDVTLQGHPDWSTGKTELQILLHFCTGTICLMSGALFVYWLIRRNPWLLKGSKRILFVKHKTVDALVLPPKIPLSDDLVNKTSSVSKNSKIFVVLPKRKYDTQTSNKSHTSGTPSYISAEQPTEDQLAKWRLHNHFKKDLTIRSNSELSVISCISHDLSHFPQESKSRNIYASL